MHPRFHSAFTTLTPDLQHALEPMLNAGDFSASFSASQIAALQQHTALDDDALALALLPLAAACAVAPLSNFNVGAVARGVSGSWYFGANMEFVGATMQQTVHAEQSAITHAWLKGETALAAITVNYSPCGHCRQFMNELNSGTQLRICLPERAPATLADYLPHAFGPRDLAIDTLLLDPIDHGYLASGDALEQQAIAAASRSHAPYSQAHSGVALEIADGQIFAGRYAENAAFNPSLPPLQAALILRNMHNASAEPVVRAVLAESTSAKLSQRSATEATLKALGCENVRTISLQHA
ncbi:cytidine deaminase [Erwinia sp. V71]|uniref:cytidine deaminase n=1 Tax=Erwinia sp. V71 TaxID=3369424 RepID=UPI003F627639